MGSNPPIVAVPFSVAQPKVHIARYLESLRPYVAEHAYRGANYFHRSRKGGDQLCEEDWNPDYRPPDPILTLSNFLNSHSSPYASTSQLTDYSGKGSVLAEPLRPARMRDNTKTVDHERGKQHRGRSASAQRTSPYQIRYGLKSAAATAGGSGDQYVGSGLRHQPTPPQQLLSPDLSSHDRAPLPDAVAPLGVEFETARQQFLAHWNHTDPSSATRQVTHKRLANLDLGHDQSHQDVVQAAASRLNIARPGIFARGVTSKPIKVAGTPQLPSAGAPLYQLDERLLLGLAIKRAQQQQAPPPAQAQHISHSLLGNLHMGSSFPWTSARPYPPQPQQQTPPGMTPLPMEDPILLEAMLPFYASRQGDTQQQQQKQQQTPSALASLFPTDLSNLVSPIDPTSSPFDVFETIRTTALQASEQRAVSADLPRWDMAADAALDWARPVSAPPSKLAPTPPGAAAPVPLPTPTFEPEHQDLSTGFCDTNPGGGGGGGNGSMPEPLQQHAKPLFVDTGFTLRPNDFADFDLQQWSPFPDQSKDWILSPASHPAPYTYGFSPHAVGPDPTSHLPTASGPSGSSPFPSFQDAYTPPQDSPYDSTADLAGPAPALPAATTPAGLDSAGYL